MKILTVVSALLLQGRLGRLSMKVTQFFYDLSDFISAVDS